jgi:hypothetical protein
MQTKKHLRVTDFVDKKGYRGVPKMHAPLHIAGVFDFSPEGFLGSLLIAVFRKAYMG